MKVHQFTHGFWEHEPPSLSLGCKRLRPLAPKLPTTTATACDLKSFIRPESGPRKTGSSDGHQKKESTHQGEAQAQPGGTRWNPTQEQIGVLEMLYGGGMRTPNAQQIEHITEQLAKYGKIEGKNVFYWFQNHKARERQKQKRNSLHSQTTPPSLSIGASSSLLLQSVVPKSADELEGLIENNSHKRKCSSSWAFDRCLEQNKSYCTEENDEEGQVEYRTLKLFPLHPEGRSLNGL